MALKKDSDPLKKALNKDSKLTLNMAFNKGYSWSFQVVDKLVNPS